MRSHFKKERRDIFCDPNSSKNATFTIGAGHSISTWGASVTETSAPILFTSQGKKFGRI